MRVFAIDLEATGQCTKTNFVTQIGACCIDSAKYDPLNTGACIVSRFSTYLQQPAGRGWEERCVSEFWAKHPEQWEKTKRGVAEAPADGVERFLAWIKETQDPDAAKNVLVCDNSAYDFVFLDSVLPPGRSLLYLFGDYENSPMDTHSYSLGVAERNIALGEGCNKADKGALARLNTVFPTFPVEHDHDAGNDAQVINLKFAHIFTRFG